MEFVPYRVLRNQFAEIAISGEAEALVTGNGKHFSGLKDRGVTVLSPAQFLEWFV